MNDELVAVSVLNGEITVGDTVAIAVGSGRYGSGMRVGTVLEIQGPDKIKVRVTHDSGAWKGHKHYTKSYDMLQRVVKL